MDNLTGKVFLGRFRVDEFLSTEAGYYRFRGFDLKRNISLSIRTINHPIQPDPSVLCFQQNNLTLQTIMHPNIIPFYGLYQDQGMSFVIEKFIDGPNLNQIMELRNQKPVPPSEALIYFKALGTALEYVHGFGLVHSTVSPIHIQNSRDGLLMLANFGFSRTIEKAMTETGIFGPPFYMAPEQLRGERVFPSTDIYALGILLFELLSGFHPFLGRPSNLAEKEQDIHGRLRQGHLTMDIAQAIQSAPNIPPGLADTILTATHKNPKERYQSAQEMLEICCAVMGTTPKQVPDRLGGQRAIPPTQVVQPGFQDRGAGRTYSNQPAFGGTEAVAPRGDPGSRTAREPLTGTQVVPPGDQPPGYGTQIAAKEDWRAVQPGLASPGSPRPKLDAVHQSRRPSWLFPVVGVLAGLILLCIAAGVWAGLPYLKEMLATATPSPTLTQTNTPTATLVPPTEIPPPIPTEPVIIPVTEPPPPPTSFPTEPPTEVSTPTSRTAFKVTVRNNLPEPIFAFRNGTIMGTDPIPPGMYIWYLNIPAGQHYFRFCFDMSQINCPQEQPVMVDDDITITVR